MNSNIISSDKIAFEASIDPSIQSAGTIATPWLPAKNFVNHMGVIKTGTMSSNSTVDAKFEQATDDTGANAKDIDGKAITQLSQAGTDDSNKQAIINLHNSQLDTVNNFDHFRLVLDVGTADSVLSADVLGTDPIYSPASDFDAASVSEIVN